MTERINCITPGCKGRILPATVRRTGGYCMPCVQKKSAEEHAQYVKANRKDFDPFSGVNDLLKVIEIMHIDYEINELVNRLDYKDSKE